MSAHTDAMTDITIVGAGPAGLFCALLLARKGIKVHVLESFNDFDRDFRGDTVHASTMEVLDQIGLADAVLELPHQKIHELAITTPTERIPVVSYQRVRTRFPYITFMPQSTFLAFLYKQASTHGSFSLTFGASVQGLVKNPDSGRVEGVTYHHEGEAKQQLSGLVIATDGRFSRVRKLSGLTARVNATPMDVAWLRLPRNPTDGIEPGGFFVNVGRLVVLLPRNDTWQIGYVFPSGNFNSLKAQGIEHLQTTLAATVPLLADRVHLIETWHDVHLLRVVSDCLQQWHRPGLLLLGDAAHVMSPVGGVGINAAIGDAVECANTLLRVLAHNPVADLDPYLAEIQTLRLPVVQQIQRVQALIQRQIVRQALRREAFKLPLAARIILSTPLLRDIPAKMVALGPRPARLQAP